MSGERGRATQGYIQVQHLWTKATAYIAHTAGWTAQKEPDLLGTASAQDAGGETHLHSIYNTLDRVHSCQ